MSLVRFTDTDLADFILNVVNTTGVGLKRTILNLTTVPVAVPANADTVPSGYTVQKDTLGAYNPANPTRLTCPAGGAGTYKIGAAAFFNGNYGPSNQYTALAKNGTVVWRQSGTNADAGAAPNQNLEIPDVLVPGDFYEVHILQHSAVNQNLGALRFWMILVGTD